MCVCVCAPLCVFFATAIDSNPGKTWVKIYQDMKLMSTHLAEDYPTTNVLTIHDLNKMMTKIQDTISSILIHLIKKKKH